MYIVLNHITRCGLIIFWNQYIQILIKDQLYDEKESFNELESPR